MSTDVHSDQVSESKLRQLLNFKFESDELDFKEMLRADSKKGRVEICKDLIAMANTAGGHIVAGVRDGDFAPVGIPRSDFVDSSVIHSTLENYVSDRVQWLMAYHELEFDGESRLFCIFYVVPSDVPIVTSKAGAYQEDERSKTTFSEGAWLVRSGARSKPASPADVRALLKDRQRPSAPLAPTARDLSADYEPPVLHNLPRPNFLNFIGREAEIKLILETLEHERAWTVSIEGIGGVGKTALAQKVALDLANQGIRTGDSRWKFIIWMSAKESVLAYEDNIEKVTPGFLNLDGLLSVILDVTSLVPTVPSDLAEKKRAATEILNTFPCLLIVDNLETVADEAVEKFVIDELPAPSKAIVTSRQKTTPKGGLIVQLKGMDEEGAIRLLQESAIQQGSVVIASSPRSKLLEIVNLVGGIPLALKLVVGQTALGTNLGVVIERLLNNQNAPILDFCFAETYRDLEPSSKMLLVALAQFDGPATLEEIAMVAGLAFGSADHSLKPLLRLSIVDESFDDNRETQTYSLLPLTKSFAEKQARLMLEAVQNMRQRLLLYRSRREQHAQEKLDPDIIREAKPRTDLERLAVALAVKADIDKLGHRKARELLIEAETLAPRLAFVLQKRAFLERKANRVAEARKYYERAVEVDRTNSSHFRYWATMEAEVGQYDEAVRLFREAILLDASDHRANHGLASALFRSAKYRRNKSTDSSEVRTRLLDGLDVIDEAFNKFPNETKGNHAFWVTKAQILAELGRPRQALDICIEGLKIGPNRDLSYIAGEMRKKLR